MPFLSMVSFSMRSSQALFFKGDNNKPVVPEHNYTESVLKIYQECLANTYKKLETLKKQEKDLQLSISKENAKDTTKEWHIHTGLMEFELKENQQEQRQLNEQIKQLNVALKSPNQPTDDFLSSKKKA